MFVYRIFFSFFSLLLVNQSFAQNARRNTAAAALIPEVYLQTVARPGDDLKTLLQRYTLEEYECNQTQFFKINKLKKNARLQPGTTYKLPVLIRTYNGKSIRSSLNIKDFQMAIRIDAFNKSMLRQNLRLDDFVESKRLWVPWHELHCPQAKTPDKTSASSVLKDSEDTGNMYEFTSGQGNRVFPIFGSKYAKTPIASRKLRGRIFYIVSGHGGPDVGAQGTRAGNTLCEDEYAYDVSLRLLRLLVSHGATAYMIVRDPNDGIRDEAYLRCDKDETVWGDRSIPFAQRERLIQRSELINALTERNEKAGLTDQTLIEIHVDSRSHNQKTDVFFYYRPDSEPSKALAQKFHQTFLQKYLKVRGQRRYEGSVTPRALHMLRETITPTAVYIELGNIRNDWDQQRLVIPSNRQAVANWLCLTLLNKK